jgi:OOP family OmpA-OmpF porin
MNKLIMVISALAFLALCWFCLTHDPAANLAAATGTGTTAAALAPPSFNASVTGGKVTLTGTLPDEASKAAIISRARELYGDGNFTDNLKVGSGIARPAWLAALPGLLPFLKLKDRPNGGAEIDGNGTVTLSGQVAAQEIRNGIVSDVTRALPATWTIRDAMFVSADAALSEKALEAQTIVNRELADRIIEFDTGKTTIRQGAAGTDILNQVADILGKYDFPFEVSGHTDNRGNPAANQKLSQARAQAVRAYLTSRGIAATRMTATGYGDKKPVADNNTPEGLQRNRRIEFSIREIKAAPGAAKK